VIFSSMTHTAQVHNECRVRIMTQLVTEVYFENGVCIAAFSHILLVLLLLLLQPFNGLFSHIL